MRTQDIVLRFICNHYRLWSVSSAVLREKFMESVLLQQQGVEIEKNFFHPSVSPFGTDVISNSCLKPCTTSRSSRLKNETSCRSNGWLKWVTAEDFPVFFKDFFKDENSSVRSGKDLRVNSAGGPDLKAANGLYYRRTNRFFEPWRLSAEGILTEQTTQK